LAGFFTTTTRRIVSDGGVAALSQSPPATLARKLRQREASRDPFTQIPCRSAGRRAADRKAGLEIWALGASMTW